MTKRKDKPYWIESLACYLFIFAVIFLFLAVFIISGQLTGTNWLSYLKQLAGEINSDTFKW